MRLLVRSVGLLTATLAIVIASYSIEQWRHLWRLEHANVNGDVAAALRQTDLRLLAIEGGAGIVIPAVSDSFYQLAVSRPCTRVIYVGDAFYWDWERRTHDLSVAYAAAYNTRRIGRAGAARICAQPSHK